MQVIYLPEETDKLHATICEPRVIIAIKFAVASLLPFYAVLKSCMG